MGAPVREIDCHGIDCGLRMVLLGHHVADEKANGIARTVIGLGGIIALVIISAMLGAHAAST